MTLQDYLEKGVTQISVKDGEATAVNPYEQHKSFSSFGGHQTTNFESPSWRIFEGYNLPPIPCPAIPDGVYEIGELEEAYQVFKDEWHYAGSYYQWLFETRTVLVLKDQPEEKPCPDCNDLPFLDCETCTPQARPAKERPEGETIRSAEETYNLYCDKFDVHKAYRNAEMWEKTDMLNFAEEHAQNRLSEYKAGEWVSVEEARPKEGQIILAIGDGKSPSMCKYVNSMFERYIDTTDHDRFIVIAYTNITHWMSLPKPPQQ